MNELLVMIPAFFVGISTGVAITNRWWNKTLDRKLTEITQTDEQLMIRLGMAEVCRNCGCQEQDR